MATTTRETERKYDAAERVTLPELSEFGSRVGPQEQLLEATYYDTPDLRLARDGLTLRRRRGGSDDGWHLKLPVSGDSRDEIRVADDRGPGEARPPVELTGLATAWHRGAALAPVATITTVRRRWILTDTAGRPLVELVDDQVTARTMGESTTSASWREIEVELAEDGDHELLDLVERRLVAAGMRRSGSASKLARVLGERLRTIAGVPARTSGVGQVVLTYLSTQAEALRHYDPLVRRDVPDALHQMRVATRRMRSALQVFGPVLDRERTRRHTDELKWLTGVLGPSRDLEVLRQRWETAVAALPVDLVVGPVAARLARVFGRREADARAEVLTALDGDRYLALLDAIDDLLARPPLTDRAHRPVRRELPRLVDRAYRRVKRRMRRADRAPVGPERDAALHEVRKAAKRLRYAAEAAAPVLGRPARRLRKRVKAVQQLLGEHQDAAVARPELRDLGMQAHFHGENGFTYGVLHCAETARAQQAEQELPAAWRKLRRATL